MYVQDIKLPGTNITAEILKSEAYNFQNMCSTFASAKSHGKCIDEYVSKLSSSNSAQNAEDYNNKSTSTDASRVKNSTQISMQSLQDALKLHTKIVIPKQSMCESPSSSSLDSEHQTATNEQPIEKIIQNLIDFHTVYHNILERSAILLIERLLRMTTHNHFKREIISTLNGYVKDVDSTLELVPFGSNEYNLNESGSNFNLFVFTSTFRKICYTFMFIFYN